MKSPSFLSALKKLRLLLDRQEKIRWLGILAFILVVSCLEILTASVIVVFARVLSDPALGEGYLHKLGFSGSFTPNRSLFYISIAVGAVYLVKNLVAVAETFFQNFSIQRMNFNLKNRLLNRYAEMDYGAYLRRNSSHGAQLISGEVNLVFSSGMVGLATIISEAFVFLSLTTMIIYMNPSLAIWVGSIGLVLGVLIAKVLLPRFYRWGLRLQEASILGTQHLFQFFHSFKEIILLGKKESFIAAYKKHSANTTRTQALQTAVGNLPRMGIEALFVSLFVSVIAFLCLGKESPMTMLGVLGGYFYAGFRLMPGLNRMMTQISAFKAAIPSIERVYKDYTSVSEKGVYENVPNFTFKESIVLDATSFQYLNTKEPALKDISFEIKKGETIGVVGETGSGKSTLVDVILGLLRPYEGKVLIDSKFPAHSYQWHQKIGYVPQSIYLTDDTIAANIAFGEKDIDDKRLRESVEAAQLHKLIEKAQAGLATVVGERGIRLSGGERQRIAIARALYRNPEVLIFDEATSALDTKTETKLMETIRSVSQDRTVIMIAHRLSTLKDCNKILVMEHGVVKGITTYEKISQNSLGETK